MSHRALKFLLTAAALASLCPTLVGCGAQSSPYSLTESRANPVNAALEPYLQEFLALFNQKANLVPLTLGPLEKGVAGKCFIPGGKSEGDQIADSVFGASAQKTRRIVISMQFFEKNKDNHETIQNVVFHELGHCILNRGHTKLKMPSDFGQIPSSIMYPVEFGDQPYYQAYYDHYVQELFTMKAGSKATDSESSLASSDDVARDEEER